MPRLLAGRPCVRVYANEIVLEKRGVTADTALRFARYFNMSPLFWLGLRMDYELDLAEDSLSKKLEREVRPYSQKEG